MWYRTIVQTFTSSRLPKRNVEFNDDDDEATLLSNKGKTMNKKIKRRNQRRSGNSDLLYWVSAILIVSLIGIAISSIVVVRNELSQAISTQQQKQQLGLLLHSDGSTNHNLRSESSNTGNTMNIASTMTFENTEERPSHAKTLFQRPLLPPSIWASRNLSAIGGIADNKLSLSIQKNVASALSRKEKDKAMELCGKFLYSSFIKGAVEMNDIGYQTFVSTGDIDDMWTRDSVVQMSIYLNRPKTVSWTSPSSQSYRGDVTPERETPNNQTNVNNSLNIPSSPFLRLVIEGAIRRNAFNIIQDPYGNAYSRYWRDPLTLPLKDQVIGRGGFVATRNYELDSGAYFLHHLYDYYYTSIAIGSDGGSISYRPELLLQESLIFESVSTIVDIWIIEQHHDDQSLYRYFELPNEGKGTSTAFTGMTWSGFRPSDDPCQYGYLIPANIHAAGALERTLILNERIWHHDGLEQKVTKLLLEIERGINEHGIVTVSVSNSNNDGGDIERIYAYEVDGKGGILKDFDDANVPSLLSIPLLGWSKYDKDIYQATRKRLLSAETNKYYFQGNKLQGIGSPHTPREYIWPMALIIQALTEEGLVAANGGTASKDFDAVVHQVVFQFRQLLSSACNDAMHESVHAQAGCPRYTRFWFEWVSKPACSNLWSFLWTKFVILGHLMRHRLLQLNSQCLSFDINSHIKNSIFLPCICSFQANALFVVFVETMLGERCDTVGRTQYMESVSKSNRGARPQFYQNKYRNNHTDHKFYQGIEASVKYMAPMK